MALKSKFNLPLLSFKRLWRSNFASRIAHVKFVEPRWLGEFRHLPMALTAAGRIAWAWRTSSSAFLCCSAAAWLILIPLFVSLGFSKLLGDLKSASMALFSRPAGFLRTKGEVWATNHCVRANLSVMYSSGVKAILPVVGLVLFAQWSGSLIGEFSVPPSTLVQQPMPPAVADPGAVLKGWVDVPRPIVLIRPEVIHELTPVPGTPQSRVTPTPSVPQLQVTQIFARLDRGEITVEETKALLAAQSSASHLVSSRNQWPDD